MTRDRRFIIAAVATVAYVSSWFLPVNGLDYPGWKAFRVAFAPVWPYGGFSADGFLGALVSVGSALTNVWFLVGLAALALKAERLTRTVFWGLVGATILNASWLLGPAGAWGVGYFLWLSSFILLAVAVGANGSAKVGAVSSAAV